jgi:hypothetical protein
MVVIEHRSSTDNYLGKSVHWNPHRNPRGSYGVWRITTARRTPATVDPKSLRDLMVMNAAAPTSWPRRFRRKCAGWLVAQPGFHRVTPHPPAARRNCVAGTGEGWGACCAEQ